MRSQDSVFNLVEFHKEKLEWVTPKISLMEAGDTEGVMKAKMGVEDESTGPS
jgi:hypothetical protein